MACLFSRLLDWTTAHVQKEHQPSPHPTHAVNLKRYDAWRTVWSATVDTCLHALPQWAKRPLPWKISNWDNSVYMSGEFFPPPATVVQSEDGTACAEERRTCTLCIPVTEFTGWIQSSYPVNSMLWDSSLIKSSMQEIEIARACSWCLQSYNPYAHRHHSGDHESMGEKATFLTAHRCRIVLLTNSQPPPLPKACQLSPESSVKIN